MPINIILGPAGGGKTHRCLTEVKAVLLAAPDGAADLLFVAPRQSTYLLERQLLGLGVSGFTRLEILPFDQLALRILEELGKPVDDLLSEEGRIMVLRELLLQNETKFKAFKTTARAAGFSAQLSKVLRELQRGDAAAARLGKLKLPAGSPVLLDAKLHDLALLLEAYRKWMDDHRLRDSDELLIRAAAELSAARKSSKPIPAISGFWLDGFAEMTGPEINLLSELLPCCASATLAFCLDHEPGGENSDADSASLWSVTQATVGRLKSRIEGLGLKAQFVQLPSDGKPAPRFQKAPALESLATSWTGSAPPPVSPPAGLNFIECTDPEAEALLAVKLINDHIRQHHGRYREVSVTVRRMDDYADALQRAFRRHSIPFFIDHRESMGHHPLAELTRTAFSMAARNWPHDEWMNALKTGLVADNAELVDNLENATLASGLRGDEWLDFDKYTQLARLSDDAVKLLHPGAKAFLEFRKTMSAPVDGRGLAKALNDLWTALKIPETLEKWESEVDQMKIPVRFRTIHRTAWEQMGSWNTSLALAFAGTKLEAKEWLPIAEAGLSSLTLGSIPPALDQVFIGAVDRARQPEVKLAIVLGLNGGVFPAPPPAPALLNRAERVALNSEKELGLTWDPVQLTSREQYYAYIACTRPSERLCVSWSRRGLGGKMLTRSAFAERLLAFAGHKPNAEPQSSECTQFDGGLKSFSGSLSLDGASSWPELLECPKWDRALPDAYAIPPLIGLGEISSAGLREQLVPAKGEIERRLGRDSLKELYPEGELKSSVSALETFANCPFRHFANQQLRLNEREEFKADQSTIGTLLHAILKRFHEHTLNEKKWMWRNWEPAAAAAEKICEIGRELMATADFARQSQDELVRWESDRKIKGLAEVVKQIIEWFKTNSFDPVFAEFKFREGSDHNGEPPDVPSWKIDLAEGKQLKVQGSIDRVDVCRLADGRVLVAVFDYKTGGKSFNRAKLQNGYELQLLGYLAFAVESADLKARLTERTPHKIACESPVVAAGAFYVPLTPKIESTELDAGEEERRKEQAKSLTHQGRADKEWRLNFDSSAVSQKYKWHESLQFKNHPASKNFVEAPDFCALLSSAKDFIRRHAESIMAGRAGVEPARFGTQKTACEYCPYLPVCRFEPVLGDFRAVTYVKPKEADAGSKPSAKARAAGKKSPGGKPSTSEQAS
ncbi:MAG: PD-(D/E)XK nuclease family protein [Verrucomicrobiota bacterium]